MVRNCNKLLLVTLTFILAGCGYNSPKDQCIWNGTECEHGEPVRGERGEVGPAGPRGEAGNPGRDGRDGVDGSAGRDGSSCSATRVSNGASITCTDGTGAVIFDGAAGEDGEDAPPTAYSVVEMRDPCGDQSGFDEILMRTANGMWIAHFSSGGNNFLTVLTPGTYRSTDSTRCQFTLNSSGQIVSEVNY